MSEQESGSNGGVEGGDPERGSAPRAGRLGGLLQDLLAAHGRRQTAELLGVSERTLSRATQGREVEGEGAGNGHVRLTEPLSRALQRYEHEHESELPGSGELPLETAYELAALRRRVDKLEREKHSASQDLPEVHEALARLEASLEEVRQQVAQGAQTQQGGDTGRPAVSVSTAPSIRATAAPRRRYPDYPELVTVEADAEEERFYGAAMETIAEWRLARLRREQAAAATGKKGKTAKTGGTLERLRADERLLQLELELVGEHGLTLPPADRPWDGIRRQSELRVLRQSLGRVRRDRRRAQVLHWTLRLLTLGLWGLLERRRRS